VREIACFNDLTPFGIEPLTGEACGLGYRLLCDVTEPGRRLLAKLFGTPDFTLAPPWNRGAPEHPHIGSILLTQEMVLPIDVFALLENGCSEVFLRDRSVVGLQPDEQPAATEQWRQHQAERLGRRLAYRGTAGDRNVHVISGRVS
jgi:hypothetical protein